MLVTDLLDKKLDPGKKALHGMQEKNRFSNFMYSCSMLNYKLNYTAYIMTYTLVSIVSNKDINSHDPKVKPVEMHNFQSLLPTTVHA